jgi:hypothetical protein
MIELFEKILGSPAGSFAFVFGIIVLGGWLVHYVTKFTTKISIEHNGFKEETEKTKSYIDEIRKDMAFVKGSLEVAIGLKDVLTQKHSPISLTEMGDKMVKDYNLTHVVEKNWDKIIVASGKDLETKNPYDLQEYFIETSYLNPATFFSDDDVDYLKTVAYKCGFPFMSIARVMGILIRDKYFEKKNIAVEEIDKCDPNNKISG